MLFFYEIKKLIKNKAVQCLALLLLAVVTAAALRSAASSKALYVEADEAAEAYAEFAAETERTAAVALRSAHGGYAADYYSEVILRYRAAADRVFFQSGDVSGWDELLCLDIPLFAALFISVVLGAVSFYEDVRAGTAPVISASKKGRRVLAANRTAAAIFLSALFCVCVSFTALACFGSRGLIKNGSFCLQSAPSFSHSAEDLTLIKAFAVLSLRRCLICASITACACLISKLLGGYIPIILVSAAFPVLEFALFSIRYNAVDVLVKNVNIFAYGGGYLLKRFYCADLFGKAYPEVLTASAAITAASVCVLLAVLLPERRASGKRKLPRLRSPIKLPQFKARPHGLFAWEFIKLFRTPQIALPVCLCVLLGTAGILINAPVKASEGERLYRAYCEEYSTEPVFSLNGIISEEEARISSGINRMDEADALYGSGRITFEEYNDINSEFIDCLVREGLIPKLEERAEYLLRAAVEFKCDTRFVYDTGLGKLVRGDALLLPMLAVILIACSPFMKERESGAINFLRACKNGRGRLYLIRLLFVFCCAAAVMLAVSAAELYALSGDGIFDSLSVPSASIELLHSFGAAPIRSFLRQMYAMRLAAAVCAALITFALSALWESPFLVLAPAGMWFIGSLALSRLGVSFPPADLSAFVSGSAALASAGPSAWLNMLPLFIITALSVAYSYRKYAITGKRQ